MEDKIRTLINFIDESENIVFFGGAGVSTESGIPDFRSKDGLYNQHDVQFEAFSPEYLLSTDCLHAHPKVFFEFYRQKMNVDGIQPNVTHRVLAELEQMGKLSAVITQNIDGLHQKAGSQRVLELHGTTLRNYCERCKQPYPPEYIFESDEDVPRCDKCGGMIRPDVTLYGENLPHEAFEQAYREIHRADMLMIAGTSLKVQPAAGLIYEFTGKHLVVMNREPLDISLNGEEDLIFQGSMGEVFRKLEEEYIQNN